MLIAPYAPADRPAITRCLRLAMVENRWSTLWTTSATELSKLPDGVLAHSESENVLPSIRPSGKTRIIGPILCWLIRFSILISIWPMTVKLTERPGSPWSR